MPAPLLAIGGAMALAGGGLSALGSYQQGQFQKAVGNFNARQSMIDAEITEQNADEAARRLRLAGRKLQGSQKVAIAKSGFRLEGTPLEVMAESMKNIELDAINTQQEGMFRSAQLKTQSKFQRAQATAAGRAGTIGAVSSLLGGGAGAAKMFAGA